MNMVTTQNVINSVKQDVIFCIVTCLFVIYIIYSSRSYIFFVSIHFRLLNVVYVQRTTNYVYYICQISDV